MQAIVIHGMARTPLSMMVLANRLQQAGIPSSMFLYSVTFESWQRCSQRLQHFINKKIKTNNFIIVGHSLGCVLTRAVLPQLNYQPKACFFIAPPSRACIAAQFFASNPIYKLITGEIGQLLAIEHFMQSLPIPSMLTKIYAGTTGWSDFLLPLGKEPNDGVLTVSETLLPSAQLQTVHASHTFIMNSKVVFNDILNTVSNLH